MPDTELNHILDEYCITCGKLLGSAITKYSYYSISPLCACCADSFGIDHCLKYKHFIICEPKYADGLDTEYFCKRSECTKRNKDKLIKIMKLNKLT